MTMRKLAPDKLPEAIQSPKPIAVYFTADWCGPCQRIKPLFIDMMAKAGLEFVLGDFTNASDSDPVWGRYGIELIPTIVVYKAGKEIHRTNYQQGRGIERSDIAGLIAVMKANT